MNTILHGIVLGLSITAPIGPTNIEIIRRGTKGGWRAAAMFCLGVMVALILYLALATIGLSFLTESEVFSNLLTVSGILILGYLSYTSLKEFFSGSELNLEGQTQGNQHFIPGILLTIANPAILLLWTGIMGADLAINRHSATQGLLLSLGIIIGVTVFFTALTLLVHYGRKFLRQQTFRYVSLIAGIFLLYFCFLFTRDLLSKF